MKNKIIKKIDSSDNSLDLQIKETDDVGDIMSIASKDVISASQSSSIIEIANIMSKNNIRRIPITDPGSGKILGIVTTMDILDFFGGGKKYNIITEKYKGNFLSAINAPIKEIMTSPVKVMSIKDTIIDAASVMLEEKVGGLPVTDEGKIVGMITEGEVVEKLKELISKKEVQDIMVSDVITTTPGTRIEGITKIMVRNSIRRIPIVGEDTSVNSKEDKLLGFVTSSDVLRYIGEHKLFSKVFSNDGEDVVNITIDELMVKDVITTTKYEKLDDIVDLMFESKIKGIPVVDEDDGKIIGMVTIRDLLKSIIE